MKSKVTREAGIALTLDDSSFLDVHKCVLLNVDNYRVIESIRISEMGLLLGLLRSEKVSICSQDWAQILGHCFGGLDKNIDVFHIS